MISSHFLILPSAIYAFDKQNKIPNLEFDRLSLSGYLVLQLISNTQGVKKVNQLFNTFPNWQTGYKQNCDS